MKDINATVVVDLSSSEEELFDSLKRDVRKGIRKAIKSRLVVRKSEEWEKCYKVYEEMCKRNNVKARTFESFTKNAESLFVCKKDGKIIAISVVWFIKDYDINVPRVHFSAISKEFADLKPNNLLYWEMFKLYKRRGYKRFDLGGWQINPRDNLGGVNKFKERFGPVVYYYVDYPFHNVVGRKLIRNLSFFWWLNKKLKNLGIRD